MTLQELLHRANALVDFRRYREAEKLLRECSAEFPNSGTVHALRAVCLLRMGDIPAARVAGGEAIRLNPEDAYGFYVCSLIESEEKRWDKARDALNEALRLDPYDVRCYGQLAWIMGQLDDWKGSQEMAEKGLAIFPQDESCLCHSALSLWNQGKRKEARERFKEALRHYPESGFVHHMVGLTYDHELQAGNGGRLAFAAAIEHFSQSLRHNPEGDDARLILQNLWLRRVKTVFGIAGICIAAVTFIAVTFLKPGPGALPDHSFEMYLLRCGLLLGVSLVCATGLDFVAAYFLRFTSTGRKTLSDRQHRLSAITAGCYLALYLCLAGMFCSQRYACWITLPLAVWISPFGLNFIDRESTSRQRREATLLTLFGSLVWLVCFRYWLLDVLPERFILILLVVLAASLTVFVVAHLNARCAG